MTCEIGTLEEVADREARVCRMPMGLDIVVTDRAPARLPGGAGRPHPSAPRLLARGRGEYLFVGMRGDGAGALVAPSREVRPSREIPLDPGDICFYAADRPPFLGVPEPGSELPGAVRAKVFLVPWEALGLAEGDVRRVVAAPVGRSSRLGMLLSPFLSELADAVFSAPPPVGELLGRNAVHLLATLAADPSDRDPADTPDARSPLLSRILRFVDLHLADADLSPEAIAGAHHISVRYLHKLFQDEGTTVGRWIRRRRLEECRRDLLHRVRGRRTIAAVAGRWGFLSATHFSRVFRAAYGMSPSEWRDSAGREAYHGVANPRT
ncbi:transcriptional regulator with only HTH domain, AraC family [Actinobacteria bacterium OK074]|nr:transcriptional regulator with only HTH domain, AraC family [Actinobacteria bacterium OK074]